MSDKLKSFGVFLVVIGACTLLLCIMDRQIDRSARLEICFAGQASEHTKQQLHCEDFKRIQEPR